MWCTDCGRKRSYRIVRQLLSDNVENRSRCPISRPTTAGLPRRSVLTKNMVTEQHNLPFQIPLNSNFRILPVRSCCRMYKAWTRVKPGLQTCEDNKWRQAEENIQGLKWQTDRLGRWAAADPVSKPMIQHCENEVQVDCQAPPPPLQAVWWLSHIQGPS